MVCVDSVVQSAAAPKVSRRESDAESEHHCCGEAPAPAAGLDKDHLLGLPAISAQLRDISWC